MSKASFNCLWSFFFVATLIAFMTAAQAQDEMLSEAAITKQPTELQIEPEQTQSPLPNLGDLIDNLSAEPIVESSDVFIAPEGAPFIDESDFIDPDFLKDEGKSFDDFAKVTVRILDKITADTRTYDLDIGKTVAYGPLRLRPMACKKSPPIEEPESASFLQIWEKITRGEDKWIFSGWMFASSPSLSAMEHPVYDVWIIDCKD